MHDHADTIHAIASPPGQSLRGIVRLSGHHAFDLLDKTLTTLPTRSRGLRSARFRLDTADARSHVELPLLLMTAVAPNSYTGEDTVELHTVGNPHILNRIIATLDRHAREHDIDLRPAGPGEFTARAYLQGRITLTQAEGVAATIAARSSAELTAAAFLRQGQLGTVARVWMQTIAERLALVEAGIDFTDQEDVVPIPAATLRAQLDELRSEIAAHVERRTGAEPVTAIPWVVLVGEPNAGKSSLFNALLGTARAVVSNMAGTTRDMLTEPMAISTGGRTVPILLVDVAGTTTTSPVELSSRHHDADPNIDTLMDRAAHTAFERAQLRLLCIPHDRPGPADVPPDTLIVRTKCDQHEGVDDPSDTILHTSARTGAGLDVLRAAVVRHVQPSTRAADVAAIQPRHEASLEAVCHNITSAIELLDANPTRAIEHPELVALELRQALDQLSELIGEMTPDDVLGLVFSRFCVGK